MSEIVCPLHKIPFDDCECPDIGETDQGPLDRECWHCGAPAEECKCDGGLS